METKLCRKCGKVKPIAEFGLDAQKYDGKCWWCKDCMRASHLKRQAYRKQGRSVALARVTTEEILNELKHRLLWQEEDIIQ